MSISKWLPAFIILTAAQIVRSIILEDRTFQRRFMNIEKCGKTSIFKNIKSSVACSSVCLMNVHCDAYKFSHICHTYEDVRAVSNSPDSVIYATPIKNNPPSTTTVKPTSSSTTEMTTTTTEISQDVLLSSIGYYPYKNDERWLYNGTTKLTWDEALKECETSRVGARLFVVKNSNDGKFLYDYAKDVGYGRDIWVGLQRFGADFNWNWLDNSEFDESFFPSGKTVTKDPKKDDLKGMVEYKEREELEIEFRKEDEEKDAFLCEYLPQL